jgi:dipeptidase E
MKRAFRPSPYTWYYDCMKLFLASLAINKTQAIELSKLAGKPAPELKLALFENAADPADPYPPDWMLENRAAIMSHGFDVEILDLRGFKNRLPELRERLEAKDVIWFGGGNVFYLRWLLRHTGTDQLLHELVESGKVYGGGSAGAVVAGTTLKHFETADDPADAPEAIWQGLGLTQTVVVPHMDNQKYVHIMQGIVDGLKADGFATAPLTDAQTLVIDGERGRIS